jgi:hypothetical protein
MIYFIAIILAFVSSFFMVWGLSLAQTAAMTPKGTSKRILLEGFALGMVAIAFMIQVLFVINI